MENYKYSPGNNAFYPTSLEAEYTEAGTWPDDLIDASDDVYREFASDAAPEGKQRIAGSGGLPAWEDIPPPTKAQLIEQAETQKQFLIAEVHTETEMLRAKLALKRIKPDEEALLIAWLDYLGELEAVDVSTAPDIIWPVKPVV
ncbi:tail fiber assembly protein [Morganella morganii subsp. sibonii]